MISRLSLVAVFLLSLVPGCATDPVTGETVLGMPWSVPEEVDLGNE